MLAPQQLYEQQWVKLPQEVRSRLVVLFNIPRSKGSFVEYQPFETIVRSTGHTDADLTNISIERMQAFLKSSETDFRTLFDQVTEKIEKGIRGEVEEERKQMETVDEEKVKELQLSALAAVKSFGEIASSLTPRRRGRPPKK